VDVFFKDMMPGLPKERVIMGNYLASNKAGPLWWNYFGPTMPAYATGRNQVTSSRESHFNLADGHCFAEPKMPHSEPEPVRNLVEFFVHFSTENASVGFAGLSPAVEPRAVLEYTCIDGSL
jgi:hypothetical protein